MSKNGPDKLWRHDLKNQLGIVMGFSELVLDELGAEHPLRPDVQEILAAARRAMDLLGRLDPPSD